MPPCKSVNMLDLLQADTSAFAIRPANWSQVSSYCSQFESALAQSGNANTIKKDEGHMIQYWQPFVTSLNTPFWRTDTSISHCEMACNRETFLIYLFLMYIQERMPAKRLIDRAKNKMALPASVAAPVGAMRRQHKLRGYKSCLPSLPMLGDALRGMERCYTDAHGQDALIPSRKYAMPHSITVALISIPEGSAIGSDTVQWSRLKWRSLACAITACASTGYRKAEIGTQSGVPFGNMHLSRANLFWIIHGVEVYAPSPAQMRKADGGYIACIGPPPSKADFSNKLHGFYPSYMRWRNDPSSAAYQLALLEVDFPIFASKRASTPLFMISPGIPFSLSALDHVLALLLRQVASSHPTILKPEHCTRYSWHSFRRGLASALVKLNVPPEHIQRICRWATPESLKQYGIMDADTYCRWVERVHSTTFQSAHVSDARRGLADLAEVQHYSSLVDNAHATTFTVQHTAAVPRLDNDDLVANTSAIAAEVESAPE